MGLKDVVQNLVVAGMEALDPGTLAVFAQPRPTHQLSVCGLQLLLHIHSVF